MEGITVSKRPEDDVDELLQTPFCDALSLTAKEREVLKLWDLSEDLRLEQAILRAQADGTRALCARRLMISDTDDWPQSRHMAQTQHQVMNLTDR